MVNERCYVGNIANKLRSFFKMRASPNLVLGALTPVLPIGGLVPDQYVLYDASWSEAVLGPHFFYLNDFGVDEVPEGRKFLINVVDVYCTNAVLENLMITNKSWSGAPVTNVQVYTQAAAKRITYVFTGPRPAIGLTGGSEFFGVYCTGATGASFCNLWVELV